VPVEVSGSRGFEFMFLVVSIITDFCTYVSYCTPKRDFFEVRSDDMDAFFLHRLDVEVVFVHERRGADAESVVVDEFRFLLLGH